MRVACCVLIVLTLQLGVLFTQQIMQLLPITHQLHSVTQFRACSDSIIMKHGQLDTGIYREGVTGFHMYLV